MGKPVDKIFKTARGLQLATATISPGYIIPSRFNAKEILKSEKLYAHPIRKTTKVKLYEVKER